MKLWRLHLYWGKTQSNSAAKLKRDKLISIVRSDNTALGNQLRESCTEIERAHNTELFKLRGQLDD